MENSNPIIESLGKWCGLGKCSHSLHLAEILSGASCATVGDGRDGVHVWVAARIVKGRYAVATRRQNLDDVIALEIFEEKEEIVALWVSGHTLRIPDVGEIVVVQHSCPFFGKNPEVPVYWWNDRIDPEDFKREMNNFQKRSSQ